MKRGSRLDVRGNGSWAGSASVWGLLCVGLAVAALLTALPSAAELTRVTVGGQIRIRGNYWKDSFNGSVTPLLISNQIRWPQDALRGRALTNIIGGGNVVSHFNWDNSQPSYKLVEQRTRLNVRADFTDDVVAFIELDSFDAWGEDFRSNYITGVDGRAATGDDVEVYQAFIQADNMFGLPLRARIGRQEMVFGKGWLVGDNSALPEFTGLSFDGIRLTYTQDVFSVDAFWTKLAERGTIEEDGDMDFAGVYASCHAVENVTFDAYWFWLRDAIALKDTNSAWIDEKIEDWLGLDDYDVTNLHTVGLRAAGTFGAFDFDAEAAYQFGNASQVGFLAVPYTYGDDGAEYGSWAADVEVGYSFDFTCKPRVYVGGAYVDGEDNRDVSFWEWLNPFAPFCTKDASVSFNRLFSNTVYSYFFDEIGELSNFWQARAGVSAHPTEAIETTIQLAYFGVVEPFDEPIHVRFWHQRWPLFSDLSFWTREADTDIGWQLDVRAKYHYSSDLTFEVGWSRLFTGDALHDGNFSDFNGLGFNGGTGDADADYLFFETALKF